mgnify:CR=1 FL=1
MAGQDRVYRPVPGLSRKEEEKQLQMIIRVAQENLTKVETKIREMSDEVYEMYELLETEESEAKQALTEAGTKLLTLKRRLDEVSHEQADLLDMLLSNMADADLNSRMKALTDEKASLKEQILEAQQEEVGLEEQVAKRQQMWDSLTECSEGYTEFDDEFIRQIIQKITVEDADTIHIQFRDSNVVLEQGL